MGDDPADDRDEPMRQGSSPGHDPAAPPAPGSTMRSRLRWVFMGQDGLRAGWGLIIFAAMLWLLGLGAWHLFMGIEQHWGLRAHGFLSGKNSLLEWFLLTEGSIVAIVAMSTWLMSWIEQRPVSAYGLSRGATGTSRVRLLLAGSSCGIVSLSLLVGCLWANHNVVFEGRSPQGAGFPIHAILWAIVFLLVAAFEESFFRGYLQYTLTRGISGLCAAVSGRRRSERLGFVVAALLTSSLFAYMHTSNQGESRLGLVAVASCGFVFCLSLWRTGSLWWAFGFHGAWDWAQSYLFGVADSGLLIPNHILSSHPVGNVLLSGGPTGPEGSVLVFPILLLTCGIIMVTSARRTRPYSP